MTDLIVDGNSLFARAWYATVKFDSTGAVGAALSTVLSLLNVNTGKLGEHVDRMLFAWDGPGVRNKDRQPKPPGYHETKDVLIETLAFLFNPAQVVHPQYEADDLVATAALQSEADMVFVASGDKDLEQIAGGHVYYYSLHEKIILSHRAIQDKWGIKRPNQVAIALAVIGDKVDLIKGVKGWGKKKVRKLFEAVSPDMDLEQAMDAILAQMPEDYHDAFLKDLDLTLLHSSIKGVPQPAPIRPAPMDAFKELKLIDLYGPYRTFLSQYGPQQHRSADHEY